MKRSASALLLLLPIVTGWLSISQARYGATLDDLRDQTYMQSTANADRSIGWLWSRHPSSSTSISILSLTHIDRRRPLH